MNITIKYMDGLQNKWQTLTEDDFLVVTDWVDFYNDMNVSHYPKVGAFGYTLSYDSSTGKLTFRQPYVKADGIYYTTSTEYHSREIIVAFPCTVYYKSSELPVAP